MSIKTWLKEAKKRIAALDAELILMQGLQGVLGIEVDRSYLVLHEDLGISRETWWKLDEMVERRVKGEPLAYILGWREFYGRRFQVDSRVLIPRPETEMVVDLALEAAEFLACSGQKTARILEIGTGSGCIAATLGCELRNKKVEAEILAMDLSEEALEVAENNARNLGTKVKFLRADLLEKVAEGEKMKEIGNLADFDVLVANLPYVDAEWVWISRKSLDFEPQEALYAAEKGLALYDRLLSQISQFGAPRYLIFEADPCQHEILVEKTTEIGYDLDKISGFGLRFRRK